MLIILLKRQLVLSPVLEIPIARNNSECPTDDISCPWANEPVAHFAKGVATLPFFQCVIWMLTFVMKTYRKDLFPTSNLVHPSFIV
ncbi:MAG: hypothetical protein CBC48_19020 [bacterium TMED88]|nr:MAG: hypothetical protein CBC48_19020 [bacterium TMED88]